MRDEESQKPLKRQLPLKANTWYRPAGDFPTLAKDAKEAFRQRYLDYVTKRPYYPSKDQLAADMKKYKAIEVFKFSHERRKSIILDDSMMKYLGFFEKKSHFLNPRNPTKKDETIVDYDMDSEEEWNEQNGEDVNADNKKDDEEDDEVDKLLQEDGDNEEAAGFIVPDDYLSASELNLTQS